jgi:hypothetical protein
MFAPLGAVRDGNGHLWSAIRLGVQAVLTIDHTQFKIRDPLALKPGVSSKEMPQRNKGTGLFY